MSDNKKQNDRQDKEKNEKTGKYKSSFHKDGRSYF